jgi:WD40 repeat protein
LDESAETTPLLGHRDRVLALDLAPNGRHALSGSADSTVRFWNLDSQESRSWPQVHGSAVQIVRFHPDGRTAFSGDAEGMVVHWDLRTGRALRTFGAHRAAIGGLDVSWDGRRLATTGGDPMGEDVTIRVWDLAEPKTPPRMFTGHDRAVNAVRFLANGSLLTAAADGRIILWDIEKKEPVRVLEGHRGGVQGIETTLDGRFCFSGGFDGALRLWDLVRGECLRVFEGHDSPLTGLGPSLDGRMILTADHDGRVLWWTLDWRLRKPAAEDETRLARPWVRKRWMELGDARSTESEEEVMNRLFFELDCLGFGWVARETIRSWLRAPKLAG